MTSSNNMKTLILLILMHFASSEKNCKAEQRNEMHKTFTSCTEQYYQQFETKENNGAGPENVFCELFDHLINDCGDIWKICHESSEVADMKEMQIQSLYRYYDAFYVDNCDVIKKYKEKPFSRTEKCSEQDQRISQNLFQKCSHGISSNVYENIQGMSDDNRVTKHLCVALAKIEKSCSKHLSQCMSSKDSTRILHLHLEEIEQFFDSFMQNIIPTGRFTGCDSFTFQMGENLENQNREPKGHIIDMSNQKTSENTASDTVEVGQYVAKEKVEEDSAKNPENVEQTSVLSYLESVYNTHLETFDINQDINQAANNGQSDDLEIADDTIPDKALSEETEKQNTKKEPYNQNENQSDDQVANKSKLQNAASELLSLLQYATITNINETQVNQPELSMPMLDSMERMEDNEELVNQDKLEKRGPVNEGSLKSQVNTNDEARVDGLEEENNLDITHNTSNINGSENENITDVKAFNIKQDINESIISTVQNNTEKIDPGKEMVIQEDAKNELNNESKIEVQDALNDTSEQLKESENDVIETDNDESESIIGNALFKLFQYATQTDETENQEVSLQLTETKKLEKEMDPLNNLNATELSNFENSSSISTSQLKEENTKDNVVSNILDLPGSHDQTSLPIDREDTNAVKEITNLIDKPEVMNETNYINQNSKSGSEVKNNFQISDAGSEDTNLAKRGEINKTELTAEEAENVISTLHPDPEHQFGWTKWKPSDEKLVIPGTGIYPRNHDEKSPKHLRNADYQERLFPPNSSYSDTLMNTCLVMFLIFIQMFLHALQV